MAIGTWTGSYQGSDYVETFSQPEPTAGTDRKFVVAVIGKHNADEVSPEIASVTVGGVTATRIGTAADSEDQSGGVNSLGVGIFEVKEADISSITTSGGNCDIVVQLGEPDAGGPGIICISTTLTDRDQSTPTLTAGTGDTSTFPASLTLNSVPEDSDLVAVVGYQPRETGTPTWTTVTSANYVETSSNLSGGVAEAEDVSSGNKTVTVDPNDGGAARDAFQVVAFEPATAAAGQADDVDISVTISPRGDDTQGVDGRTDTETITYTITVSGTDAQGGGQEDIATIGYSITLSGSDSQGVSTAPPSTGDNQSDKQASVRAVSSTTLTYEGDWHSLFDDAGIAAGPFEARLLQWINQQLSSNYINVSEAMSAFAIDRGAVSWSALGVFNID